MNEQNIKEQIPQRGGRKKKEKKDRKKKSVFKRILLILLAAFITLCLYNEYPIRGHDDMVNLS